MGSQSLLRLVHARQHGAEGRTERIGDFAKAQIGLEAKADHLAFVLGKVLDGIEQGLEPTPMCEGNGYELEDADPLPADLNTALDLARESDFMKSVVGEDRLTILIQQGEREQALIDEYMANNLTPVETERYLTNL